MYQNITYNLPRIILVDLINAYVVPTTHHRPTILGLWNKNKFIGVLKSNLEAHGRR